MQCHTGHNATPGWWAAGDHTLGGEVFWTGLTFDQEAGEPRREGRGRQTLEGSLGENIWGSQAHQGPSQNHQGLWTWEAEEGRYLHSIR